MRCGTCGAVRQDETKRATPERCGKLKLDVGTEEREQPALGAGIQRWRFAEERRFGVGGSDVRENSV